LHPHHVLENLMRKWWPLVAICLGTFMLLIDVTIVNVALPDMANSLHTSFTSLQWVVDAYALALAALLLGIGSFADLIGHRKAYLIGLVVFAVSSLVCGLSPNGGVLIAARTVQGVGGAAMFATTSALLNSTYQGRDRGKAFGWWGAVASASAAVGPILGGLLVEGISWRWIFFVNLPVSVLAIGMTLKFLTDDGGNRGRKVDLAGTATFTVSAAAVTFALIRANEHGWATGTTYGLFALSAVALAAFIAVETHSDNAMLDLGLFKGRSFVGTMIAALLINFAAFAYFTYTSIWLQTVVGLSPIEAGLTGLPLAASSFLVSAVIGRFLHSIHPGPIIGGGMVLIGAGGLLDALLVNNGSTWPQLIPGFIISGIGVGLAMPTLTSAALGAVPVQRGGMAAGAVNTARQLGYAIGIALLGTVFSVRAASTLRHDGLSQASSLAHGLAGGQGQGLLAQAGPNRSSLNHALHTASISGLDGAFIVAGIAGVVAGVLVWILVRPSRAAQSVTDTVESSQPAGAQA
jgi:EmrB/QacA subfamily drug resistance transporter